MKRYTNALLIGLYVLGLAAMLVTMLVIRYRLDRAVELTV